MEINRYNTSRHNIDGNQYTIYTFQTGRLYSEKGQRIAAVESSGSVFFVDLDRNIDGLCNLVRHECDTVPTHAMWCYDRGRYDSAWFENEHSRKLIAAMKAEAEKC